MLVKEKKYRFFSVMMILCMLFFVLTAGISERERRDSAIKAMVFIEDNGYGGNGSVYKIEKDKVIIVTTYHLLQNGEKVTVHFADNRMAEGSVLGINKKHDVGFIEVELANIPSDTLDNLAVIQRSVWKYTSLRQGDFVEYSFLTYDGVFVRRECYQGSIGHMNCYVPEFKDFFIYNYCEVRPGMSGCAAVADDGSYLGMVIGGYENESAALSIYVIDEVYKEIIKNLTKS